MRYILYYLCLIFVISGCAATSKSIESDAVPKASTPQLQEQLLPSIPPIAESDIVVQEKNVAPLQVVPVEDSGIGYSRITNIISEFIDIQPVEGELRFLGFSENKLVSLEIIGNKDNVSEASMKLFYPNDIDVFNIDLNEAMMFRFLNNIAPEFGMWQSKVKDIVGRFNSMGPNISERESMVFNKKIIYILYDKKASSIILRVCSR
jgi:hypothetical protein